MARMDTELYCDESDLHVSNLRVDDGDVRKYIESASDEMDSHLSKIYVTPLPYSTTDSSQLRATSLILKQICSELASGRLVLGAAGSKQDSQVHAYGRWLVERALGRLEEIVSGEVVLEGTGVIPVEGNGVPVGPLVSNTFDSQVDAFYNKQRSPFVDPKHKLAYGGY